MTPSSAPAVPLDLTPNTLLASVADQADGETLRRQNELLLDVLDDLDTGLLVAEPVLINNELTDFRIIEANTPAKTVFGGNIIGKSLTTLLPAPALPIWQQRYCTVYETGEPIRWVEQDSQGRFYDTALTKRRRANGLIMKFVDVTERHELEQEKQRQTELLQTVVDNVQAGMLLLKAEREPTADGQPGRITDFRYRLTNEYNARLGGKTPAELNGQRVGDLFPGWQETPLFPPLVAVTETGQPIQTIWPYSDYGWQGWFDSSFVKVDDGVLYTYLDVTALKQAQHTAEEQAALMSSMLDNTLANLTLFTPVRDEQDQIRDFQYVFTNPGNARMVGRTVEEMTNTTLLSVFPGIEQTDFFARLRHTADTGEPSRFLFPYQGDGVEGWFDTSFVRQGDRVLFTSLDVTELKNTERVLQQQTDLQERILDATPNAILVCEALRDANGHLTNMRYVAVNETAGRWLGLPADDLRGRLATEVFPEVDFAERFSHYARIIDTGAPLHAEEAYGEGYYEITTQRWGNNGIIISAVDLTERYRYQRQLEHANTELRRSNEYLQQFAYVASHDLQEPLRKIQSFGDVILNQHAQDMSAPARDMLLRMQRAAGRMSDLVRDLLSYSRLTTRQQSFEPVALTDVVQNALADMELTIRDQQASVTVGPLPTLPADPTQMQQLFQNLLGNALKYTRPDKPPYVTVASRPVNRTDLPTDVAQTLAGSANATYWEISVADRGIGFEEKYLDRLFQMFQRLHGKHQYEGSGMGLAICKRVIDNHQGHITARSQPGQGTTFLVYLPA